MLTYFTPLEVLIKIYGNVWCCDDGDVGIELNWEAFPIFLCITKKKLHISSIDILLKMQQSVILLTTYAEKPVYGLCLDKLWVHTLSQQQMNCLCLHLIKVVQLKKHTQEQAMAPKRL